MDDNDERIIDEIIKHKLTYLERDALLNIRDNLIKTSSIEGDIIEAGCALGGSSICIGYYKEKTKIFNVYDVFGQIPPPSARDESDVHDRYKVILSKKSKGIDGELYYGYRKNLLEEVKTNFKNLDVSTKTINFIKGLYEDTLKINKPVSYAHIDCDWYDSVMTCLTQIIPNLSPGGIITLDDYYSWSGCRKATDDYFKNIKHNYIFEKKANRLNIIKK